MYTKQVVHCFSLRWTEKPLKGDEVYHGADTLNLEVWDCTYATRSLMRVIGAVIRTRIMRVRLLEFLLKRNDHNNCEIIVHVRRRNFSAQVRKPAATSKY